MSLPIERTNTMDPNATLAFIREWVACWANDEPYPHGDGIDAMDAVAGGFRDLDEWLSKGGFLPTAWQRQVDLEVRAAAERRLTVPLGPPNPAHGELPE